MSKLNLSFAAILLLLAGCDTSSQVVNRTTGVYMLLDTSGTYAQELEKAQQIINFTLSRLNPGDSFAVARIDTGSFSHKTILIFSDLKEDLDKGYIRDFSIPFDDTEVIALNVTKLRSDNIDPREYMDRLQAWRTRVDQSDGLWRVINDLDQIENIFG